AFHINLGSSDEPPNPWHEKPALGIGGITAAVQNGLALNGLYDGRPDGIRTEETRSAISEAEYIFGLESSGRASQALCRILEYLLKHKDMILPLQIIFFDRGEITGQPDGIIDRETRLAIERAEIEFDLMSPDGLPDDEVFIELIASLETRPLQDESLLASVLTLGSEDIYSSSAIDSDLGCNPIPSFDEFTDS
ncbi:MAG: peptidoglycan-binding domain-containing protein, partial [Pseudomonadota bacterium]